VGADERTEFVRLFVQYHLIDSVRAQYDAFHDGFHAVAGGPALKAPPLPSRCSPGAHAPQLFRPDELELLVCGNPTIDFEALRAGALYEGFDKHHPLVRALWDILTALDDAKKKRFLFFCTGSDRSPIKAGPRLQGVLSGC
jgi:hypothetical protein